MIKSLKFFFFWHTHLVKDIIIKYIYNNNVGKDGTFLFIFFFFLHNILTKLIWMSNPN